MIKFKKIRKALSVVMTAAMLGVTVFTGSAVSTADAATSASLISGEFERTSENNGYITTCYQWDYLKDGYNAFELKYKYTDLGTLAEDDTVGYDNTLCFKVFDSDWQGWNATAVGPNYNKEEGEERITPTVGPEYTVTIPFRDIERKLSTDKPVLGINLEMGEIAGCKVQITSLCYTETTLESESVVMEGAWHKTSNADDTEEQYGSMQVTDGFAYVNANPWNIGVSGFDVHEFTSPIVAVTVEYGTITNGPIYPQAEVLKEDGTPVQANYPQVSEAGEVTYLTSIPTSTKAVTLAYDTCTVKKVEIYDEDEVVAAEPTPVGGLTNANIIENMGAGWNLGNALDSVTAEGKTDETAWGNPEVNKRTFKLLAAAGIKTVRIPVSWVDAVTVNGDSYTIDETRFADILARVKEVVDMARAYDLFVIINIQHDSSEDVARRWLDIDAGNQTGIQAAFANVWDRIAEEFKDYDDHLIFESMNEVMEQGKYNAPSAEKADAIWANINFLNESFVNTVRAKGQKNLNRFLLIPGYNTNINQTVAGKFVMPKYKGNNSSDKIMVSVHFYDPYDFTLNTGEGSKTFTSVPERNAIATQFGKMKEKFVDKGIPVVIGEFGAVNKNNTSQIRIYITEVVKQAKAMKLGYVYWDNGYTGENGMGLWNRYTYAQSELGKVVLPILP